MRFLVVPTVLACLAPASADAADPPDPRRKPRVECPDCSRRYVAPNGNDLGAGSAEAPWQTLQRAADQVEPGTMVVVRPGHYQGFEVRVHGKPDKPVIFSAEPGVEITGDNPNSKDCINIEQASHVVVSGFKVSGGGRAGIRAVDCHHVSILGNEARDNHTWGIFTGFCEDLVIEDNLASGSQEEHGIYVSNSADKPVLRRNYIFDNAAAGIHMNGDKSMGGDGVISEAVVENNVIFRVGKKGASGINADGVQSSLFRNNLIVDAHATGIALYRIDGGEGSKHNAVVNNTVVIASDGRYALHIHHGSTGNFVRNNILLNLHGVNGAMDVLEDSLPGLDSDHNLVIDRFTTDDWTTVIDLAQWQKKSGQDKNTRVVTPEDVFAPGGYGPRADGPAIDKAVVDRAPAVDLFGHQRPVGAFLDIGAIEHCEGAACVVVAPEPVAAARQKAGLPTPPPQPTPGARGCGGCACQTTADRTGYPVVLFLLLLVGITRRASWRA
jgi:parallel beta-helix repeat protein